MSPLRKTPNCRVYAVASAFAWEALPSLTWKSRTSEFVRGETLDRLKSWSTVTFCAWARAIACRSTSGVRAMSACVCAMRSAEVLSAEPASSVVIVSSPRRTLAVAWYCGC